MRLFYLPLAKEFLWHYSPFPQKLISNSCKKKKKKPAAISPLKKKSVSEYKNKAYFITNFFIFKEAQKKDDKNWV